MFFWKTPKLYRPTILFVGYTVLVLVALLLSLFIAYLVVNAKGSWVYPDSGFFYLYFIPLSILMGFLTLAGLLGLPFLAVLGLFGLDSEVIPSLWECHGNWISICFPSPLAGLLAAMFYTAVVAIINHLVVKRRFRREQETQKPNLPPAKKTNNRKN